MSLSIENLKESDEVLCDEEKSFSTEQLFSFALQIAKGMVNTIIFWITFNDPWFDQNDGQNRECIYVYMYMYVYNEFLKTPYNCGVLSIKSSFYRASLNGNGFSYSVSTAVLTHSLLFYYLSKPECLSSMHKWYCMFHLLHNSLASAVPPS